MRDQFNTHVIALWVFFATIALICGVSVVAVVMADTPFKFSIYIVQGLAKCSAFRAQIDPTEVSDFEGGIVLAMDYVAFGAQETAWALDGGLEGAIAGGVSANTPRRSL